MPRNSKKSNTKSSGRSSSGLKSVPKLSKTKLVFFAVAFAVMGGFFMVRAFATTTVATYRGSLRESLPTKSYSISTGTGDISAILRANSKDLDLTLRKSSGEVIQKVSSDGFRKAQLNSKVTPGTYIFEVSYNGKFKSTYRDKEEKDDDGRDSDGIRKKPYTLAINYPLNESTNPSAIINKPQGTDSLRGTVSIEATATDDTGISKVEFYVGATLLSTDTSIPYTSSWDTTSIPNGDAVIRIKAFDVTGNTADASVTVRINNPIVAATPTPTVQPTATPVPTISPTPAPTATPVPTIKPTPTPTPVTPPVSTCGKAGAACTKAEIAIHNKATDCWVIFGTNYLIFSGPNVKGTNGDQVVNHSGGSGPITPLCGGDATSAFNTKHGGKASLTNIMNSYIVGPVN